jgi:hypothetical protein
MAGTQIVPIDENFGSAQIAALFQSQEIDKVTFAFKFADPAEVARKIEEQELAATSFDALLGGGTVAGKEYVGKPVYIDKVDWFPTQKADAAIKVYAVLRGSDVNGEQITITCGARSVMRKIAIADANGWLPRWMKISSTPLEGGNEALDLVKVDPSELPFEK